MKEKFLAPEGIEPRLFGRAARSLITNRSEYFDSPNEGSVYFFLIEV